MKMNLETLIAPVLQKVCEYCVFRDSGYETPQEVMLSEIRSELSAISQRCVSQPVLLQQYRKIEKPLIFFIDYTIKEGGFSFSRNYQELARSFNELSGDDKFFDLLENAIKLNDDREVIRMFYLMMGLGFDGYYKRRPSDIIPVMEEAAAHMDRGPDFNSEPVTPDVTAGADRERPRGTGYFLTRPAGWILMMSAFLLLSFLVNWAALTGSVSGFLDAAEEASAAAEPYGGSGAGAVLQKQEQPAKQAEESRNTESGVKADEH